MEKEINGSKRGLTFSFIPTKRFKIGSRYDYIIHKDGISIVPAAKGRYTVSRKKNGDVWSPLIDLRNKEILKTISEMESIRLQITDDAILVSDAKRHCVVFAFPRIQLAQTRKVVGLSEAEIVSRMVDGQISLGGFFAKSDNIFNISTLQKDIPDIYSVVSLFSGAGILDYPFFKDKRFNIQYAIDYDAGACETYRENIGTHIIHADVFLHGVCGIFALVLQDMFGYPIEAVAEGDFDNSLPWQARLIHVYCRQNDTYIDVRGAIDNWDEFLSEFSDVAYTNFTETISLTNEQLREFLMQEMSENEMREFCQMAKALIEDNKFAYSLNSP